jgi:hypothetical protein
MGTLLKNTITIVMTLQRRLSPARRRPTAKPPCMPLQHPHGCIDTRELVHVKQKKRKGNGSAARKANKYLKKAGVPLTIERVHSEEARDDH